jgi:hypothetical protein
MERGGEKISHGSNSTAREVRTRMNSFDEVGSLRAASCQQKSDKLTSRQLRVYDVDF